MKTPVAFLIFNRPDTTEKVFQAIRQAQPPQLSIVADGPRPDRPEDVRDCAAARSIIEQVDWDCQVMKNYADVNLGCRRRIVSGLDWVFDTVDRARSLLRMTACPTLVSSDTARSYSRNIRMTIGS
jgi:hypothetical protein